MQNLQIMYVLHYNFSMFGTNKQVIFVTFGIHILISECLCK